MDLSDFDCKKEFDKYKEYLSSCLKTPELTKEQEKELERVLKEIVGCYQINRMDLSDKKDKY